MTGVTYPIGVIDEPIESGAIFSVMPLNGREMPGPGTPVTVWNQTEPGGPMARFKGEITEVTASTGTMIVTDREIDHDWPGYLHPMGRGNPVYIALPDSYVPDQSRSASREELALMMELAKDHEKDSGIKPSGAAYIRIARQRGPHE